ncbi:MAG TPA: hypothetical protein VJ997_05000 [Longimicrobiales bacterium]|nr:hypothetical protein [Longimicrobiales bacterium]
MADPNGYGALRALVRLEMRRSIPLVGRALIFGGVLSTVLLATGTFTFPRLAFVLGLTGIIPVMAFPMNALRDKLDGGLEFLRILPVPPETQAAARLLALAVVALPAALLCAVAAALALQADAPQIIGPQPVLGLFVALSLGLVGFGFFAVAVVLRFPVHQSGYLPLMLMAALVGMSELGNRYLPDPVGAFLALSGHAWFLPALWTSGIAMVGALGWLAFHLASEGIARFRPAKNRILW